MRPVIIDAMTTNYPTIEQTVGNTPLVRLQRIPGAAIAARGNVILAKLEGNNPAGSVKDRPALSMILHAEARGEITPGDTLIEATSGNTGIALAMTAAMRGYRMVLIMPDNLSIERHVAMTAYGAELILTPADKGGMDTLGIWLRKCNRKIRVRCWINFPTPTIRKPISKPQVRKSGHRHKGK